MNLLIRRDGTVVCLYGEAISLPALGRPQIARGQPDRTRPPGPLVGADRRRPVVRSLFHALRSSSPGSPMARKSPVRPRPDQQRRRPPVAVEGRAVCPKCRGPCCGSSPAGAPASSATVRRNRNHEVRPKPRTVAAKQRPAKTTERRQPGQDRQRRPWLAKPSDPARPPEVGQDQLRGDGPQPDLPSSSRGEDGLITLQDSGRLTETAYFNEVSPVVG